jgi:8-oxo-dGTP diphosphatase
MTRLSLIPAVYILIEKEGKFLFMIRANTGYQDGNYQLPCGHIEEGETPHEAAAREAQEEVGVTINAADLQFMHAMYRMHEDKTGYRLDVLLRATRWTGEPRNAEPEKCSGIEWLSPDELPENTTPYIRHMLQTKESFSEYVF